jgi:ribonuclease BN (tRNA processing enzyme)
MRVKRLRDRTLSLANDGTLDLFFIGVGSAFTKRQYQTNLLIIKGNDHLLIDCGTRCPQALVELGLKVTDIRNILITHSHADHIGGMEEVALMGRYVARRKPVMVINEAYEDILWNMSLKGGCGLNEKRNGRMLDFPDLFEVIRPEPVPQFGRETFKARVGGIHILMMRTKHIPDNSPDWQNSYWSCGIIIDDRVMFTSDTRYDPDLIDEYDKKFDFENIFHDCQFFTGGVHAGIEELKSLPREIKKKTYLTHYGDDWRKFAKTASSYGFAGLARQHVHYIFK